MSTFDLPLLEQPAGLERELGILLLNRGSEKIALPLGSVDIAAKVINQVAQVTIKQVFRNNCAEHLEAVYIFPLAAGSAIYSFNMKVGNRVVKGVVQERAEARQHYQQAVAEGKRAALLEQERDDIFTVQVGNLPPGEEVTVEISYSERLPFYENGCNELRLPLVVSPRYIPGAELNRDSVGDGIQQDTALVPDASRITPPRLASGVDPNTQVKLKVEILPEEDAELSDLSCSQHATKSALSQGGLTVSLARADERLNRDFVLRWRSTAAKTKTSLITYTDAHGETYGLLSIMPPKRNGYLGAARDVVFVLDRSGSMQGVKMTSAVRSCNILLNTLGPNDRFAILAFDTMNEWMPTTTGSSFLHADAAGLEAGEKFLRGIDAHGGTELDGAMRSAFEAITLRAKADGRVPSLVVLTDGEVGNESQILQRVQKQIGDARLFVVGIDTAVNSGLLKRLANLGGGTATFVEPGIQLEEALTSIGREIGAPLVTDIQVENLELTVDRASLSPSRVPDVFAGRSSICFLKLSGNKGKLTVKGKLSDGKHYEEKVRAQKAELPAIAQLWAKAHIMDLEDSYRINPHAQAALKKQIIELSVRHSLLTKFTAFVVVDEAEIVNQTGDLRKVVQPVEQPALWEMDMEGGASGSLGKPGAGAGAMFNRVKSEQASFAQEAWGSPEPQAEFKALRASFGAPAAQNASDANAWAEQSPSPDNAGDKAYASFDLEASAFDAFSVQESCSEARAQQAPPAPPAPQKAKESSNRPASPPPAPSFQAPLPPKPHAQAPVPPQPQAPVPPPEAKQKKRSVLNSLFGGKSNAPFDGQSGSYGMGVRQQVFEVIVRQAIAGAPWREICAGPMQVNNITEQEVEQEIVRRQAMLSKDAKSSPPAPPVPATPPVPPTGSTPPVTANTSSFNIRGEADSVRSLVINMTSAFEAAFFQLEQGQKPDSQILETMRTKLVLALAPLKLGMEVPQLQRFLRTTAIELINCLKDNSLTMQDISGFWNSRKSDFENLKQEIERVIDGKQPAFWEAQV